MTEATMSDCTDIRGRVRAGAALLDRAAPGWAAFIDPASLDLSDCFVCVLGQVFGRYSVGRRHLGLVGTTDFLGAGYGFHAEGAIGLASLGSRTEEYLTRSETAQINRLNRIEFRLLRAAWLDEIRARTESAVPDAAWGHPSGVAAEVLA